MPKERFSATVRGLLTDRRVDDGTVARWIRVLALVWVAVSLPFITAVSAFVHSPELYIFVMVFMASGAYTAPALIAARHTVRHAPPGDRLCYQLLNIGLITVFGIGVAMLIGLVTGWQWANPLAVPAFVLSGTAHIAGLAVLVRRRSGRRALSVDLIESAGAVVAVAAPLVVLFGPAIVNAKASWYAVPAAVAALFVIIGTYWGVLLLVRLGPGRGPFEICAVGLCLAGLGDSVLQTAHGVSGFSLPFPPLIAFHALCMSMYLLIPLNTPLLLRPGLNIAPPQGQIRGSRMATVVALAGLAALLGATWQVADERPWAVPFSLGVTSLLVVLGGLRQMAAADETRRLYRQVEEASDARRQLLAQLLERNLQDRRRFAGQLYEQAVAAYTSFALLAGSEPAHPGSAVSAAALAKASQRVGGDLARQADSVRELVLAIRPLEGDPRGRQRLGTPIAAYLASVYGDRPAPRLRVDVDDDVALDWIAETVSLQIIQEALHNVWRHSRADEVQVSIAATGERDAVTLTVCDDGIGFDPAAVPEGAGITAMRASAAVIGGSFLLTSHRGEGTTVTARLGPEGTVRSNGSGHRSRPAAPTLRLVPNPPDDDNNE